MLMKVNRFRYNKNYLYGSAAFIAGYAGIMVYLSHFAPVRVPSSPIANVTDSQKVQQASDATKTESPESETVNTPAATNKSTSSSSTQNSDTTSTDTSAATPTDPVTPTEPAVPTEPTQPTDPVTPTDPTPTDPTTPIIDLPLIDLI